MNKQHIRKIILKVFELKNELIDKHQLDKLALNPREYKEFEVSNFINDLNNIGSIFRIVFLRNEIPSRHLAAHINDLEFPVLVFKKYEDGKLAPVILQLQANKKIKAIVISDQKDGDVEINSPQEDELLQNDCSEIIMLSAFSFESMVSNEHKDNEDDEEPNENLTPMQRFLRLLSIEKRDIGYIYIYAVVIGLVSLSLPLGIQAIVSLISSGRLFNTVVLLIIFVLLGIIITGGLQIMQITIVEIIQRRIFTKAAFEFAFRVPRLKVEAILNQHAPELMNRFFDILTLQKGLPKLLIDLSTAALQIVFGLILLAFYHPFFVFFGIFLLAILVIIFYYTGPKGLKTSIQESKYKYRVVYWLEELARTVNSFKLAGDSSLPMRKTDKNVNSYLKNRKAHFRILISQLSYIIIFKTLVTGGVLIIGSLLVIDRQITLGQFVASEIVIILILSSVEKIITYLDVVYDMLTAVDKIGHVTDLPLEKEGGIQLNYKDTNKGYSIYLKDLKYKYPNSLNLSLKGIDLNIHPGEKVGIAGFAGSGKSTLLNILAGIYTKYEGVATINDFAIRNLDLVDMRGHIAKNISQEDIFDGTIMENIAVGRPNVDYAEVMNAINNVGLKDYVNSLPEGLNTVLVSNGKAIPTSVLHKLILARCLAKEPRLLILNDFFHNFHRAEKQNLMRFLVNEQNTYTLLAVSNDPIILAECDRILVMQNGMISMDGTFKDLFELEEFRDLIISKIERNLA
ncbi:MAG: peptidase domain-containing ABC transporter [Cyclobacteriaceae bacterium]